jgi:hypothetical protein
MEADDCVTLSNVSRKTSLSEEASVPLDRLPTLFFVDGELLADEPSHEERWVAFVKAYSIIPYRKGERQDEKRTAGVDFTADRRI